MKFQVSDSWGGEAFGSNGACLQQKGLRIASACKVMAASGCAYDYGQMSVAVGKERRVPGICALNDFFLFILQGSAEIRLLCEAFPDPSPLSKQLHSLRSLQP